MTAITVNWRRVAVIAALLVAATAAYYPFSPGGVQARNMRKSTAHAAKIGPALAADARFRDVTLNTTTAKGGSLMVVGRVRSEQNLAVLKSQIDATAPPVVVSYFVHVSADGPAD